MVDADPAITAAVERAVGQTGWKRTDLALTEAWDQATVQAGLLLVVEAWASDEPLMAAIPRGSVRMSGGG